jgi:hypothetical protein
MPSGGKKPDLKGLHEFGARVWVHDTSNDKLGARAKEGRWIGFDEESNAHRIYWPDTLHPHLRQQCLPPRLHRQPPPFLLQTT